MRFEIPSARVDIEHIRRARSEELDRADACGCAGAPEITYDLAWGVWHVVPANPRAARRALRVLANAERAP